MNKTLSIHLVLIFLSPFLFAQPDFHWIGELEGSSFNEVLATHFDPDGNLLVAGVYVGNMDLDMSPESRSYARESQGGDGFVAKYAADGALLWKQTLNLDMAEEIRRVKTDRYGNVWVTGMYGESGRITGRDGRSFALHRRSGDEVFVMRMTPDGLIDWVKTIGGPETQEVRDLVVDADGNGYIAGSYHRQRGTNTHLGPSIHGNPDIYFAKMSSRGDIIWQRKLRAAGMGKASGIDVDAQGTVYVTGRFFGGADFGRDPSGKPVVLQSNGSTDIFFSKFDASGQLIWARSIGGKINDEPEAIKVDAQGDIYIGGWFNSKPTDFDPSPQGQKMLRDHGMYDAFLAKYSGDGHLIWANGIGGEAWDSVRDIALDRDDHPIVVGYFTTAADFDASAGTSMLKAPTKMHQAFIAKYNGPDGQLRWAREFGGDSDEQVNALDVTRDGLIVTGGKFKGRMPVEFAPGLTVDLDAQESMHRGFVLLMEESDGRGSE